MFMVCKKCCFKIRGSHMINWVKHHVGTFISIIAFIIILIFIIIYSANISKHISTKPNDNGPVVLYTTIIPGITAIFGGVCTLNAVLISKNIEKKKDIENLIQQNKPELFLPIRYDTYNALHIGLTQKFANNQTESINTSPIKSKKLVLQNSSKNSFDIVAYKINGDIYFTNPEKIRISKNDLLIMHFNYLGDVNFIELSLKSLDERNYKCRIEYSGNKPFSLVIIEEQQDESRENE